MKDFTLLDAVYLKKPVEDTKRYAERHIIKPLSKHFLFSSSFRGIPELENLDVNKDVKAIEEIIRSDYEKYSNLYVLKEAADSMQYQLNESGSENNSPLEIRYRVAAETFGNFGNVTNSKEFDPCLNW